MLAHLELLVLSCAACGAARSPSSPLPSFLRLAPLPSYAPLEFDSWALRHWTRRFTGERFTLVFFTPNGCEFSNVAVAAARADKGKRLGTT